MQSILQTNIIAFMIRIVSNYFILRGKNVWLKINDFTISQDSNAVNNEMLKYKKLFRKWLYCIVQPNILYFSVTE